MLSQQSLNTMSDIAPHNRVTPKINILTLSKPTAVFMDVKPKKSLMFDANVLVHSWVSPGKLEAAIRNLTPASTKQLPSLPAACRLFQCA